MAGRPADRDPHFAFTDPPFRHSLPVALAFAATADPPAAVLTGRTAVAGTSPDVIRRLRPADTGLNRGILRSGWGLLVRRLEEKAPAGWRRSNPR